MDIEAQPFDLRECVESALDLVAPRANEKQLGGRVPVRGRGAGGGDRRRDAAAPGAAEPAGQRGEVHRGRRGRAERERAGPGARRRSCSFAVRDTGIGLAPEGKDAAVPALQPGRQLDDAQVRRHRPRPGDQQAPGRADGRRDVGRERRPRPRLDLPLHDPRTAGRRCRRASGASSSAGSRRSPASACWWSTTTPPIAACWRCRPPSGAWAPRDTEAPAQALHGSNRASPSTSRSSTCRCRSWTA